MINRYLPDKIVLIYAIQEVATKREGSGSYVIVPVLTAEKNRYGKYQFIENIFSNTYEIVERIILNNDSVIQKIKYWIYTQFTGITCNDEKLQLIIDNIPNYITDPKYSGHDHICKYLFTSRHDAEIKLNELTKPYKIEMLRNAIEDIEELHSRVKDLKNLLYKLEC